MSEGPFIVLHVNGSTYDVVRSGSTDKAIAYFITRGAAEDEAERLNTAYAYGIQHERTRLAPIARLLSATEATTDALRTAVERMQLELEAERGHRRQLEAQLKEARRVIEAAGMVLK